MSENLIGLKVSSDSYKFIADLKKTYELLEKAIARIDGEIKKAEQQKAALEASILEQTQSINLDKETLQSSGLEITHVNVIGKDVVGLRSLDDNVIGILFEPVTMIDEDSENMYQEFFNLIKKVRG